MTHEHDWLDVTTDAESKKGMQLWVCRICNADLTLRAPR